jgi:hypothetical protein
MNFDIDCENKICKASYENQAEIVITEIKKWRKKQREIKDRLEKEKKQEQKKPILVEKVYKEDRKPILITKIKKMESQENTPPITEEKINPTEEKKTEIEKTDIISNPDEKLIPEKKWITDKTFADRRKEIPYYDFLFSDDEIPEEEEDELDEEGEAEYEVLKIMYKIQDKIEENMP